MRDLCGGVDTGVRASRRGDCVGPGFQFSQRILDRALYAGAVGLALPSGKRASVIFDQKGKTRHIKGLRRGKFQNQSLHIDQCRTYLNHIELCKGRTAVVITAIADQITRSVDAVAGTLAAPFSERVIRLGVTGLSRAGKTVFITSLVANLMDRGRMPQMQAARSGAIRTAFLQPQHDDTLPRFEYATYLGQLTAPNPSWPDGTRHISELRLSMKLQPNGLLGGFMAPRTVHIDIVDYPGEWLLDLGLLDISFADWSAAAIAKAQDRPEGAAFLAALATTDPDAQLDEVAAKTLAQSFTTHLNASREAGYSDCSLGLFGPDATHS